MPPDQATPATNEGRDIATRATLSPEQPIIGRVTTLDDLRTEPVATIIKRALALDPQQRTIAVGGERGPRIEQISVAIITPGGRTWTYALHGGRRDAATAAARGAPASGAVEAIALCFATQHKDETTTLRTDFALVSDAEQSIAATRIWFVRGALDTAGLGALIDRTGIEIDPHHCIVEAAELIRGQHLHSARVRAARLLGATPADGEREALRVSAEKFLVPQAQRPGARYTVRVDNTGASVSIDTPGEPPQ